MKHNSIILACIMVLLHATAQAGVHDTLFVKSDIVDHGFIVNDAKDALPPFLYSKPVSISSNTSEVRALADGEVATAIGLKLEPDQDSAYVVIVKQDDLYYVYSNVSKPTVHKGATIKKGDHIGDLQKEGSLYKLGFQVWRNATNDKAESMPDSYILETLHATASR